MLWVVLQRNRELWCNEINKYHKVRLLLCDQRKEYVGIQHLGKKVSAVLDNVDVQVAQRWNVWEVNGAGGVRRGGRGGGSQETKVEVWRAQGRLIRQILRTSLSRTAARHGRLHGRRLHSRRLHGWRLRLPLAPGLLPGSFYILGVGAEVLQ